MVFQLNDIRSPFILCKKAMHDEQSPLIVAILTRISTHMDVPDDSAAQLSTLPLSELPDKSLGTLLHLMLSFALEREAAVHATHNASHAGHEASHTYDLQHVYKCALRKVRPVLGHHVRKSSLLETEQVAYINIV